MIDLNKFINLNNSNEVEDMFALSQCDNIIMSNSSFRGGALGLESKKSKIISPNRWFGPTIQQDYEDRFNKNWIKISVKN